MINIYLSIYLLFHIEKRNSMFCIILMGGGGGCLNSILQHRHLKCLIYFRCFESILQCINIFSQLVQHMIIIIPTLTIKLNILMKIKLYFRRMPPFLRGEVARLVLSYTLEEQLARTTSAFLAESKDIPQVRYCFF